jgi:hypothetical protein
MAHKKTNNLWNVVGRLRDGCDQLSPDTRIIVRKRLAKSWR